MSEFYNQDVEWKVDKVTIYGTMTCPKNQLSNQAVIFVAGSGPTDRDWCSPLLPGKNGSGKLLAEELSSQGFITLRYDKLASGPHTQENVSKMMGKISMQSHVDELSGAVKTLIEQKLQEKNLFVLTNSEGAIHALNYQLQAKVKFKGLILTNPPGRPISEVVRNQISNQIAIEPDKDNILKNYDEAIASFLKGNPIKPNPDMPEVIKQLLLSLENPANLPFSRELWSYNLAEVVSKIKEPLLVVIGKKDIQVDWKADGEALETAVDSDSVSIVYPENADHVIKYEETSRDKLGPETVLRYNSSDRKLDQEAVNMILSWLKKQS